MGIYVPPGYRSRCWIEGHNDLHIVPTRGSSEAGGHVDFDSFLEYHGASNVEMEVGRACSWNSTIFNVQPA